jgi:hypothetical protein
LENHGIILIKKELKIMADTNTKKMLQFKMGLHDALPTTGKAGTVYVTTDEKAMYVDISDTDRIRLGDII